MNKKEATEIVLDELSRRLPKNNNEGFLPSDEVTKAIAILRK
tara:strand:- start:550 stop:675 length:126 start_codon:yes stop_codon:yes gene_type:complete